MGSLHKNIQLMLEFLKVLFLVLHFSCHTLMTFLIVLSVILLFMLMILLSTKRWIRQLICLIDFWTLICSTKKTGKLNWFRLTGLTTLMWKRMGLFLRKNNLLRWQGWFYFLNWIGTLTLPLVISLPLRFLSPETTLYLHKSTIQPLDKLQKRIYRTVVFHLLPPLNPWLIVEEWSAEVFSIGITLVDVRLAGSTGSNSLFSKPVCSLLW